MSHRVSGDDARHRPAVLQLLLGVAILTGVGAVAGVVWEWLWTPTVGVVVDHEWMAVDEQGLRGVFSGTGWYVVVGSVAGLLAGALVAMVLDRQPLLTLVAVVVGSVLGAWLMVQVGTSLGPPDPDRVARTAQDGTRLPTALEVTGASPWIAMPGGALLGLVLVFLGLSAGSRHHGTTPDSSG